MFSATAGEKVQISEKAGKINLPNAGFNDNQRSKPFDFLNPKSTESGVVESLTVPTPISPNNNKRLLEFLDQKKNWMFSNPNELNRSPTVKELFNVRDSDIDGTGQKTKKSIERFLEDQGRKSTSSTNRTSEPLSSDREDRDSPREGASAFDSEKRLESNPKAEFNFNNPFGSRHSTNQVSPTAEGLFRNLQPQGSMSVMLNPPGTVFDKPARDLQPRGDRLNKLFDSPVIATPLSGPLAPMNFKSDLPVFGINPIGPKAGEKISFGTSKGTATEPLRTLGSASAINRPSVLDSLNAKPLGPSSLSPAVVAPIQSQFVQPKPGVLDFPRRQF